MPAMPRLTAIALATALFSLPMTAAAADWPRADIDKALAVIAAGNPDVASCLADFKTVMSHDVQQIDLNRDGINELVVRTGPEAFGPGPSQGAQTACLGDFSLMSIAISDGKGGWVANIGFPQRDLTFRERPDSPWPDVTLVGKSGCGPVYRYDMDKYALWKRCDDGGNLTFADAEVENAVPRDFGVDTFEASYPAGNTAGDDYMHNGSTMYVNPARGLISYKAPKRSIARTVGSGDVVFKAKPWDPANHTMLIEGTAYTFKKGCEPAPYLVKGVHQADGTLVLRGAAPVRDKRSCAVKGYSYSSGNAELVFTSATPNLGSWQGYYFGSCGNDDRVQCQIEVGVSGKALSVTLEVADRYEARDVKCRLTGTFTPAGSELRGGFDRAPGARLVQVGGALHLKGVPKSACGVKLNGAFSAMGD